MSSRARAFILDFDGTITTQDTISTLFNFALSKQASKGQDLSVARDEILSKYSDDFSKHVKDFSPAKEERNTIPQEIEYYRSFKNVESRSFERMSRSGLFSGITDNEWEEFGRGAVKKGEVVVREGLGDFIEKVEKLGDVWGVVSVNFSSHFIRAVLASTGLEASKVEVLANHPDENGVLLGPEIGEGEHGSVMATSDAKLASMNALLRSWRNASGKPVSEVVYYIGDSGTDIECLTEGGTTGIVIAEDRNSTLMGMLQRVGVNVRHIESYQPDEGSSVYWARDFREIVGNAFPGSERISKQT
jgi:2-hydroxy-3-keto-5-methylthiopentenyl-1-phosphate phosphatase